jgi:plastocyanin
LLRCLLLSAIAIVALTLAGSASAAAKPALTGEVYPDSQFKIEMTNGNKKLTTIKAGTYKIKIEDKATIHDFHLKGPGVDMKTSVSGMTDTTWTVTLKPGTYTYMCDPHASTMHGSFTVT